MKTKVGVLSIQGLPPRYGAFEQTIDQLAYYAEAHSLDLHFFVGCKLEASQEPYSRKNVTRLFTKRTPGLGVVLYGLKSFFAMYRQGVRSFLIMGYGLAPFFVLFEKLGCSLVLNVDGFEWRRAKWGTWSRAYFKFCERLAVRSNAELIYDSMGVARYYRLIHKRKGHVLFYGTERHKPPPIDNLGPELNGLDYLVVVMRMEPENHIRDIVAGYLRSDSQLWLVLIGPSTDYFEKNVKPLFEGAANRKVLWLGPVYDRARLQAIRAGAVAYLHGHSVGGTNPTLVEACWLGRPVIAFKSIFNREVLGERAVYFNDEVSLSKILGQDFKYWLTPPELDYRYTWDFVCREYLKLL